MSIALKGINAKHPYYATTLKYVRFGSKADMCSATEHVRFTPESDIKCDMWNVR